MSYLFDGLIVRVTWLMHMKVICKLYCIINVSDVIVHNNNCNLVVLALPLTRLTMGSNLILVKTWIDLFTKPSGQMLKAIL